MFKNKAIQLKMVNTIDPNAPEETPDVVAVDPEQINKIVQEQVINATVVIGGAILAVKALDIFGEVVIHIAKTKIK